MWWSSFNFQLFVVDPSCCWIMQFSLSPFPTLFFPSVLSLLSVLSCVVLSLPFIIILLSFCVLPHVLLRSSSSFCYWCYTPAALSCVFQLPACPLKASCSPPSSSLLNHVVLSRLAYNCSLLLPVPTLSSIFSSFLFALRIRALL